MAKPFQGLDEVWGISVINLTNSEIIALKAIDKHELDKFIEEALEREQLSPLHQLPLSSCGPYVSNALHRFGEALSAVRAAKSAKNQEEKSSRARRAGMDLSFAFGQMKNRMETEEQEGQLFRIDDNIYWSTHFSKHLTVRVSYRWRKSAEDDWQTGSIKFEYDFQERPDYSIPRPKRKPSAAKQAQELQDKLSQTWESLMKQALWAVRDYFRDGGDGSKIPDTFTAIPDQSGGLNNHSLRFWKVAT